MQFMGFVSFQMHMILDSKLIKLTSYLKLVIYLSRKKGEEEEEAGGLTLTERLCPLHCPACPVPVFVLIFLKHISVA